MELAAIGDNHKGLRSIAKNLIALAQEPSKDALPAINAIADRLDGKPAQEATVTLDDQRDLSDLSTAELLARTTRILEEAEAGVGRPAKSEPKPSDVRKFN